MAIKDRHRRDFWVYVRGFRRWHRMPYGVDVGYPVGRRHTIAAFVDLDSRGSLGEGPVHPRLLRAAILGKRLLNLQIQEWAQGYWYCGGHAWWTLEVEPELPWLPEWVGEAVANQWERVYLPRQQWEIDRLTQSRGIRLARVRAEAIAALPSHLRLTSEHK